ncbi:MAG TPA: SAM-dependent methyltransferase [Gammaproteobacteria bacterium]|nr:SAM-dependent methyltransferase [Gammaproteobacteria bacterium]
MKKCKFSRIDQTSIWGNLIKFYQQQGIHAFNSIPYLITSTENLAHLYHTTLQQLINTHTADFFELGAGHGQFGFRFAKSLPQPNYHLIDCAQAFQDFWLSHPQWQALNLKKSSTHILPFTSPFNELKTLTHSSNQPCVWVANYFFDSLPFRGFQQHQQTWQEIYIKDLPHLSTEIEHTLEPIHDLTSNPYLQAWLETTQNLTTTLPVTVISFLEWCSQQTRPMLILASDFKPSSGSITAPEHLFSDNGTLSSTLNIPLLKHYIETQHPKAHFFETESTHSLCTFLITFNLSLPSNWSLPCYKNADIESLINPMKKENLSPQAFNQLVSSTRNDPWLLPSILELIQSKNFTPPATLSSDIERIGQNIYPMPDHHLWLICAHIQSRLHQGNLSLQWVQKHVEFYGENSISNREHGHALCSLGKLSSGLAKLRTALKTNPHCKTTLNLIQHFQESFTKKGLINLDNST